MNGKHSPAYLKQIKEQKKRIKQAEKAHKAEEKRLAKIEKLRKDTELRHAKAAKTEAIARQRKANIQAHKLHPLGIGKKSVFGKSKRPRGKQWYDLVK